MFLGWRKFVDLLDEDILETFWVKIAPKVGKCAFGNCELATLGHRAKTIPSSPGRSLWTPSVAFLSGLTKEGPEDGDELPFLATDRQLPLLEVTVVGGWMEEGQMEQRINYAPAAN
jgi:hypothetical protein